MMPSVEHDCENFVMFTGECSLCGKQVVLTGQVPVSGNDPEE